MGTPIPRFLRRFAIWVRFRSHEAELSDDVHNGHYAGTGDVVSAGRPGTDRTEQQGLPDILLMNSQVRGYSPSAGDSERARKIDSAKVSR